MSTQPDIWCSNWPTATGYPPEPEHPWLFYATAGPQVFVSHVRQDASLFQSMTAARRDIEFSAMLGTMVTATICALEDLGVDQALLFWPGIYHLAAQDIVPEASLVPVVIDGRVHLGMNWPLARGHRLRVTVVRDQWITVLHPDGADLGHLRSSGILDDPVEPD